MTQAAFSQCPSVGARGRGWGCVCNRGRSEHVIPYPDLSRFNVEMLKCEISLSPDRGRSGYEISEHAM